MSVAQRDKRQRLKVDVAEVVRSMAKSIETLANAFYANPNDETSDIRTKINDIKKDVN